MSIHVIQRVVVLAESPLAKPPSFPKTTTATTTRVMGFASSKGSSMLTTVPSSTLLQTPTTKTTTSTASSTASTKSTTTSTPSSSSSLLLYVQHCPSDGALYFRSGNDDDDHDNMIVQVSANEERIWECNVVHNKNDNSTLRQQQNISSSAATDPWVPLDGLFGIYIIPSGTIWVLITGSELIYDAPPILVAAGGCEQQQQPTLSSSPKASPWLQIRRVTHVELVHIPCRLLSLPQLKEEVRQVQLLRKALKQHSFYYVAAASSTPTPSTTTTHDTATSISSSSPAPVVRPGTTNDDDAADDEDDPLSQNQNGINNNNKPTRMIVPDMTKNLQRSFRAFLAEKCNHNRGYINHQQKDDLLYYDDPLLVLDDSDKNTSSTATTEDKSERTTVNNTNTSGDTDDEETNKGSSVGNIDQESSDKGTIRTSTSTTTSTTSRHRRRRKWWEDPADTNHVDRPDSRFFWNEAAVEPLLQRYHADKKDQTAAKKTAANGLLLEKIVPLTSAFVGVQRHIQVVEDEGETGEKTATDGTSQQQQQQKRPGRLVYDELLISRRSRFRAGTRFTKRGADATGAVANYAETEQICLIVHNMTLGSMNDNKNDDKKSKKRKQQQQQVLLHQACSHVQTRGSIPLRWSSPTDIKTYRPRVRIGMDPIAQTRALLAHVLEQLSLYTIPTTGSEEEEEGSDSKKDRSDDRTLTTTAAKLVFVNLIDKKSDQGRLGRAFDAVLNAVMEVYAPPPPTTTQPASVSTLTTQEDSVMAANTATTTTASSSSTTILNDSNNSPAATTQTIILEPNSVQHVWYDFHAEVKNGRWDRLAKLLKQVKPALLDHAYFCVQAPTDSCPEWKIKKQQRAVVRTNCMDCLDRTNVVQSLFGRWVLFHQLRHYNPEWKQQNLNKNSGSNSLDGSSKPSGLPDAFVSVYKKNCLTLPWENGEASHRLLWADNADSISRLYAGTAALKGDFTRTGKRTKRGALDDGMNSLQRYYLNNFLDADRQEGTDLMVGYAPFSNIIDTDSNGNGDSASDNANLPKMTLQEAARQMLLGNNVFKSRFEEDEEEKNFARIKQYQQHHPYLRNSLDRVVGGASSTGAQQQQQQQHRQHVVRRKHRHHRSSHKMPIVAPLGLRWLPGDVQDHMRSRAIAAHDQEPGAEFSTAAALAAIDRRASSGEPWWVIPETSDDEQDDDDGGGLIDHEKARSDPGAKTTHPGYVLSALLLGTRAPKSVAAIVVGLLGAMYKPAPPASAVDYDDKNEEKKKKKKKTSKQNRK